MLQVPPEDLAAFLAQPPPRRSVPEGLRRRIDEIMAEGPRIGCGGMVLILGLLLGLSLYFPPTRPDDLKLDENSPTVPGVVFNVQPTGGRFHWGNTHTSNKKGNSRLRYEFHFRTREGEERTGVCYGNEKARQSWHVNETVTVRYLPDQPEVACIEGAELGQFSWGMRLIAVPMIGWGLWEMGRRFRARPPISALLRKGIAAPAQVTGIEADKFDGRQRRKHITLQLAGGRTLQHSEVDRNHLEAFTHYHQTGQAVWVVYDPADPARFILPEFL